ncbi:MAG: response regulator [Phycisphaeraceae bacterium]|nr:response regulator [Phycisphaeraceae bacterium]
MEGFVDMDGQQRMQRAWVSMLRAIAPAVLMLAVTAAMFIVTVRTITRVGENQLRAKLAQLALNAARMGAAHLDLDLHASITPESSKAEPAIARELGEMRRTRMANPELKYIYTMRRVDGKAYFILDPAPETDTDGDGVVDAAGIWEPYEDLDPGLAAAFEGHEAFAGPYTDKWGTFMTAAVPLWLSGQSREEPPHGILAVDMTASRFTRELATLHKTGEAIELIGMVSLTGIACLLGVLGWGRAKAERRATLASRARSEFLANMSHEIRTPLTAILGFSELLEEERPSEAGRAEYASTIRRQAQHLLALINDILDLSKVEAGRMSVESVECSPVAIIEEVGSLLSVTADGKGVELRTELEWPLPATIRSDPFRLRQVLINLAGNAVKFTPKGRVTIWARLSDAPDGTRLRLGVTDTGIGMTPEQVSRLYRPFSQGDQSTSRQFGGTGLGLAISKRLIELMGGEIEVSSVPAEGSTFAVVIPLPERGSLELSERAPEAERAGHAIAPAEVALRGRILLVDDGPDNLRLISHVLRRAGADVETATNGREAVERVREIGPDLILMDVQMPEMDGYRAVREMRRMGVRVPVLALTADAMSGTRERCLRAGYSDYQSKPIDRGALLAMCARWLDETPGARIAA